MRNILLLLGIACILGIAGCGEKETAERPVPPKTEEAVAEVPEKIPQEVEATNQAKKEAEPEKTTAAVATPEEDAGKTNTADTVGVREMKNEQAFPRHRKGIVRFDHQAHVEKYDLSCGACHHDENGQPLDDLRYEEPVPSCFSCHDQAGRPQRDPSLSPEEWRKEQLRYYYGAIHENCTNCHRRTKGPTRCAECHPEAEEQ